MGVQPRGGLRGIRTRTILPLLCTVAAVAGLLIVWQQPGYPQVPPLPVDRSVWVVNGELELVGRVNTGIAELDSAAPLRGTSDVLQDPMEQGAVLVIDQTKHELQVLDTATVTYGSRAVIPEDAAVTLRGGTIAVADRRDGRLWVGDASNIASVDARIGEPVATLGPVPVLAVSDSGTVFAGVTGGAAVLRVEPGADPSSMRFADGPLSLGGTVGAASAADLQITTVGDTPVVLDRADTSLRIGDRRVDLPALPGAVLQQPGPANDEVLVATTTGLVAVAMSDGAVRVLVEAVGEPVAPVLSGNCRYAVWRPDGPVADGAIGVAMCGDAPPEFTAPAGSGAASLQFRQRGTSVVLTEADSGTSWVATDGYRRVDNWADVAPQEPAADDAATVDDPTTNAELPRLPPDCTAVSIGEPRALDDEFGVRAGRSTVLRVMDNDPSVDCTSVVIDQVSPLPAAVGSVAVVAGGSAIQVTVPEGAAGRLPAIEYQVGNGRGGVARATVLVGIVPPAVHRPPERVRRSAVTTEVNNTVSYNVLDDYLSPAGDDLYLLSATAESTDDVTFRPDGSITFRSTGLGEGTDIAVDFVVSDGVEQTAGTLVVAVAPADSTTPVVYPSFTTAVVGFDAVATPLRSVVSAAATPVTISTVRPEPGSEGASARLDPQTGAVTVTAAQPGSYYLTFEAATGGRAVTGVLRADFVDRNESAQAVVPMTDVAYLPPGGRTVLDPLANDTDPDGDGLAVRSVELDPNAQITAAVVDLHLVQVTAPKAPGGTVLFNYSVFDGASTAVGQIRVVPVPAQKRTPPPLAAPITTTVRAGDAVTIPVARYVTSQDGSAVTADLDPAQVTGLPGLAFSTGDTIRYLAPLDAPPGPVTFSYTAVAGSSTPLQPVQTVSTVTITVTAADGPPNSAPDLPTEVTARVFAGGAITVAAPLSGIDPDGDWVVLQSLEQPDAPLGETTLSGADTLSYRAFAVPGVDRIRYLATDPAGLTVTGEITVLVVEPSESARPPDAPDIAVSVRPGSSIRIDPLPLVTDPGGQQVRFASPAFTATAELQVEIDGQGLIVTAPLAPTVASLRYTVVNAKGLTASGSVKVTVSPDAPTPAPIAADVFVRPADLAADQQTVDVDVSGSITNRSGRKDQLAVAVDQRSAAQAVLVNTQVIRVTVAPVRQIVAYRVTDGNGSTASGFIVVPPQQQLVGPQLITGAGAITLDAGQSLTVQIADYVTVGGGGQPAIAASPAPRITTGTAVRTTPATLTLAAASDAGGPAALYVPIEYGAGAVVMTLPVVIVPRLVPPPRLDSTELQVEAGTSAAVDLAALTTTADQRQAGSLTYSVGRGSSGIQTRQGGSLVTVSVRPDVPRGTAVKLPIEVRDDDGRDGRATLTVTVTGSRKPLPTVVDQWIAQGRAGVPVSADLLTGSMDPVGLGLTVTGVTVVEGAGGIADGPTLTGSTVRFTPAAGFVGDIVVGADITDGTRDPERTVTARLRVSIQDRPSAPGTPAVVDGTLDARSVRLAWAPADANGSAIEGYTVAGSGLRQDCPGSQTSCVIDDLTPGRDYVFVVTARNGVGESGPSGPSAAIVPNTLPAVPAAPTAQYLGRGTVSVSWTVPQGEFTPVTGTSVQILQNDTVVEVRDTVGSPLTLTGLDPSSAYRFQVRATNQQGSSGWSAASGPIIPSDKPGAPTNVQAGFVFTAGQRGIQISWSPPADLGGEPVLGYRVLVNNAEIASGGGDFLTTFAEYTGDETATVSVIARNSRGEGPAATGATVAPFRRPGQVTGLSVTPADGVLQLSWDPASSPGSSIANYDYRLDGGAWVDLGVGAGTSATIDGRSNGTTYLVEVRACNAATGFGDDVRCGPASDPVQGTPFGPLTPPVAAAAVSETDGQQIGVSWSFPENGNGRPISQRTVRLSGAVTENLDPAAGSWTSPVLGLDETVTVTVRYCVQDETCSEEVTASATTSAQVLLATVPVGALTGVCGTTLQAEGEWPVDSAACNGTWVAAPTPVAVTCTTTGKAYPAAPASTTTDNRWYRGTERAWYRYPAFAPTSVALPDC